MVLQGVVRAPAGPQGCRDRRPQRDRQSLALIYYTLWLIGRNPNIRIKWVCSDEKLAVKRLGVVHDVIDNNAIYRMVFPNVRKTDRGSKRPNNNTTVNIVRAGTSADPTVEAFGVLASGTGSRTDVLIADDICSSKNTLTEPALMPVVTDRFTGDWRATLSPTGRTLYLATPWHQQDCTAHVIKHMGWAYKCYKHGKPGDPYHSISERWTREILIQRRREFGAIHYARAYLCTPLGEHVISINPEALRTYSGRVLTESKLSTAAAIISIDPASGKEAHKGKTDYFGVTIALLWHLLEEERAKLAAGQAPFEIFIVDTFHLKIPLDVQAKLAWQLVKQWEASYMLVEAKGMQSLDSWLTLEQRRDLTLPPVEIQGITFGNLAKGQRLAQAAPLLDPPSGDRPVVYFHPRAIDNNPRADTIAIDGINHKIHRELREQMLSFPTAHDDALDSCTQLLNWVRMHFAEGTIEAAAAHAASTDGLSVVSL